MGNCLVHQQEENEVVKLMRVDGQVLEYYPSSSLKVHEALSEFPGHAIAESLPVIRHLGADGDLLGGKLYYLLPPKKTSPVDSEEAGGGTAAAAAAAAAASMVRIKVVVSKQELKEMLSMGGGGSLGEMIAKLQRRRGMAPAGSGDHSGRSRAWRPALASIPEGNDVC